jgi:hypothetical protein
MNLDLASLTVKELKNLLANNQRTGNVAMVRAAVKEMLNRGVATRREYRALKWNQDSVRDAMQPFKNVASAVAGNQRTAYTQAGGRKIGRSRGDPEWLWIDTYSAIKTTAINAVFVCHIKQPGDDPEFQLRINGTRAQSYNADGLTDALGEWRAIASRTAA